MKALKTNAERDELLGIVPGPHWQDGCKHGKDCYVCTFTTIVRISSPVRYFDLYLFAESWYGVEVCIRYGDQDNEYISPGGLLQFIRTAGSVGHRMAEYDMAARILAEYGRATDWVPRQSTAKESK